MTTEIVAAYVSNNTVRVEDVPTLMRLVHATIKGFAEPEPPTVTEAIKLTASEIRKSITESGIRSFIDGKFYKTLKRHLSTNGLTPSEYRANYGLAADYPMTSPAYSAARSAMAKSIGLGRKTGEKRPAKAKAPAGPRGRPRKSVEPSA